MNIGLYFGSFNPIHTGHLVIAQHMASHHGLDEVWFVVTPHNPMKQAADLAPESDRLEMVKLAVSDNPRLKAVDVEFGLPRPNYTAHTMDFLVRRHPDTTFKIIIGEDNLRTLQQWARWRELVDRYGFLVYPRAYAEGEAKNLEGDLRIIEECVSEIIVFEENENKVGLPGAKLGSFHIYHVDKADGEEEHIDEEAGTVLF